MRRIFTLGALMLIAATALAETVKLKITYKGDGISGHTVYVMIGGGVLGSGVTDSNGEVSVNVSSLPTKSIDLKGEKKCEGAEKSWEVKGWVTLDGSNFAHLKMEEPIAEMVEASGGFMSESMMVSSYGLVCAGSGGSTSSSGSGTSSSSGSDDDDDSSFGSSSVTSSAPDLMTKEEALANQKTMLENKIYNIDNKISKKQGKIEDGKYEGEKADDAMYDIKELEVEKKITQNKLDKVNLQIEKGMLNKAERNQFKENEKALEDELDAIKDERKGKGSGGGGPLGGKSDAEKDLNYTQEEMDNMNTGKLKKEKLGLKTELGKLKVKVKTKKKFMSPNELEETETRIAELEAAIAVLEAEIEKRGEE